MKSNIFKNMNDDIEIINDINNQKNNESNTKLYIKYINYVKIPIEKFICNQQKNNLNIEDYFNSQNFNNNIHNSNLLLIEFDNILNNKFKKLEKNNKILIDYYNSKKKVLLNESNNNIVLLKNIKIIEQQYCQQCNIIELNTKITNFNQKEIIKRIITDAEYAKVYLQNFIQNTDPKKSELKGTIKILGNYNKSKKTRECYEIKVFDSPTKGTFWCNCADHKFNSTKKNIVCKHICFIICKVLKILQTYFFDTKKLTFEHLTELLNKFDTSSDIWKDVQIVRKSNKITIQDFKNFPENINDICTFCYDEMTDIDKPISVSCPLCKHCFHIECMDIWLESQSKCSYCSNIVWQYYKRIQLGEEEIDLKCNQL